MLLNWSWFDDYAGPEGRIWLAWNPLEVGVDILRVESQFVHCRAFNKRLHTRCLITVLYGAYDLIPRRTLWSALCNLSAVALNEPCDGPRSLWKRWIGSSQIQTGWMLGRVPHTLVHCQALRIISSYPYRHEQRKRLKGNLTDNVRQAKNFLDKAQALFTTYKEDIFLDLVKSCRRVYSVAVKLEISMLQQRAKLRWLKHGDQSSKIFFRKITTTRVKQRIFQITKVDGELLTTQHDVNREFISYFQNLLGGPSLQRRIDLEFLRHELKHTISTAEASLLVTPVTLSEVKEAFFDIDVESAPGPDGYTSAFFRNAWPVIGQAMFQAVGEFFRTASFSVSLNGSIHGFFKGGRGLRQGDPMSPYLFVLVMEIWNLLLRFRIKEAADFQYHWKCKDIGLINLCFADDVLLFCKAHLPSIMVITDTLNEFAALSGLKVNPAKSQIIFSRAVQQERQQILDYLGFQEGSLPVKYLGIPLTSSRLTIADCRPLIDKVDATGRLEQSDPVLRWPAAAH
ncbi:UNVERIFIED_CONTAM: hypothetical protein Sangu_3258700 [Sesamum angustifolium]|uniref:Reverse transcriptase domain-containing protein n=1 Tax=Sesamum angustifolium TaxID=2727405 RepID=A0AAW2JBQ1_9LAMI